VVSSTPYPLRVPQRQGAHRELRGAAHPQQQQQQQHNGIHGFNLCLQDVQLKPCVVAVLIRISHSDVCSLGALLAAVWSLQVVAMHQLAQQLPRSAARHIQDVSHEYTSVVQVQFTSMCVWLPLCAAAWPGAVWAAGCRHVSRGAGRCTCCC
jgi:hypothetical protein